MDKAQECVGAAYLNLLAVPHDTGSRVRLQAALGALRDELALLTGRDAEEIQNFFEAVPN